MSGTLPAEHQRVVANFAAWRRFVSGVGVRYPAALVQVWNEPNLSMFGRMAPRRVVKLLRGAVAVLGNRRVIGPGLSPVDERGRYARRLRRAGAVRVDRDVAINVFVHPGVKRPEVVTRARRAYGRKARLWVSEVGVTPSTARVALAPRAEEDQAAMYRGVLRWLLGRRHVRTVIVYRLMDNPDGTFWGDASMGLLRHDLTPKPAYGAFLKAGETVRGR